MSGHKRATISLSLEEYQRLLDVEVQQRAQVQYPPAPPPEIIEHTQEVIVDNFQWMSERQDHFEAAFNQYDDEIKRVEAAANAAIQDQQNRLMGEMNRLAGSLWSNTDQLLQQVDRHYQEQLTGLQTSFIREMAVIDQQMAAINQQMAAIDQQMATVDRSLAAQYAQETNRLSIAEQWLRAACALYNLIDREYNHPFFLPGELDRLGNQLFLAEENYRLGLWEACISSTQQVYLGLENARVRLEKEEMDWIILRQSAYEAVQAVYTELGRQRQVQAIDMDGSPINELLDVEYWSNGAWQNLVDEFLQTIEPLQKTEQPPTSAFLYDLISQYLPDVRVRLADICFSARIEALNSQLRVNIADVVIQALSVQGFSLQNYAYDQDDWRASFQANLVGLDQSTVSVQVVPSGSEIGQNELHIYSADQPLRNQRELHQRWEEVEGLLELSGLTVGDYQVVGGKRGLANRQASRERAVGWQR